ncbi:metallophosphoesterase family protein [Nocardia aobensis]|uniref:Metallophosphoesterase family protein n=1 Tax=Nocardia aobensis TaxID=257277 RepID=A0ABW6P5Q7_9NOCA
MTQLWFTADLHIGHGNIAVARGFESAEEHDAELARRWDSAVRPRDEVWVLGDISMNGKRNVERALQWISERPGTKHLVAGNHDSCHPMHSRAHKWQRVYLEVFETVQQSAVRKVRGHRVLLSHFPYAHGINADHTTEVRYPEWRFPDRGQFIIHGHTHSTYTSWDRQIHVGVDARGFAPVSLNWIEDFVDNYKPLPNTVEYICPPGSPTLIFNSAVFDVQTRTNTAQ